MCKTNNCTRYLFSSISFFYDYNVLGNWRRLLLLSHFLLRVSSIFGQRAITVNCITVMYIFGLSSECAREREKKKEEELMTGHFYGKLYT